MKIGYPCINWTIGCKADRTFRLKSYSEERLVATVSNNLTCLSRILNFNVSKNILFFRITSDLVPFASHPICKFKWQRHFEDHFLEIGDYVRRNNIRISMHPDQFTLINSPSLSIFRNSVRELRYHTQILDLMQLDATAKIQIHVGGVYGYKERSVRRFIARFNKLDETTRTRLVIENDDNSYDLHDCKRINREIGIPVLFDVFHHELNNSGETITECFELFTRTWRKSDGAPMVDYSSQRTDQHARGHAESIDLNHFMNFLDKTKPFDFDVMLEIKDKEKSALKAVNAASRDPRLS